MHNDHPDDADVETPPDRWFATFTFAVATLEDLNRAADLAPDAITRRWLRRSLKQLHRAGERQAARGARPRPIAPPAVNDLDPFGAEPAAA